MKVRSGLGLMVCGVAMIIACGGDDDDDGLGGGPGSYSPDGGGGSRVDSGKPAVLGDSGPRADAAPIEAGPPPRPTGPGPAPTRTPSFTPDGDGFFQLQTAASNLPYTVRLPVGYVATTPWPMVIGLHGCGDNAAHFATWAVVPYDELGIQPYLAVSVGGRDGGCWDLGQDEAKVLEVVADVRTMFYVHQKKVTIAGYSSGGDLAFYTGIRNAYTFAGILIENSGLPFADQTDNALASAQWKLNVAMTVHTQDDNYPPAVTHADRDKLIAAGFPVQFQEVDGTHDGTSDEWVSYLLPKIAGFVAP